MRMISSTPRVARSMTRGQPARAPLEVKAQRQIVQVLEGAVVELADGVLPDLVKSTSRTCVISAIKTRPPP